MAFDATDFTAPVRMLDRDPKSLTEPRERLEYLRDFLRELPPEKFNMAGYGMDADGAEIESAEEFHACGTAACICGWATVKFTTHDDLGDHGPAALALGIDSGMAFDLFIPDHKPRDQITNAEAASVLDHLIRTGILDWSVACWPTVQSPTRPPPSAPSARVTTSTTAGSACGARNGSA